jgi:hypothetical protein
MWAWAMGAKSRGRAMPAVKDSRNNEYFLDMKLPDSLESWL